MTFVTVISVVQTLIPLEWVSFHFILPLKIRLVFDPVKNPVYRFLKCHIHFSHLCGWLLNRLTPPPGRSEWETSFSGRFIIGTLPLLCSQSSSNCLYSSMRLISCRMPSKGFLVNNSHSLESSGNPILKMLAVTLSLSLPISLYSSQYQLA